MIPLGSGDEMEFRNKFRKILKILTMSSRLVIIQKFAAFCILGK